MQCFHLIKRERVARACCRHKIAVSANACRRRHLFLYPVYDVNARVELRGAHDVHVKADAALVVALKTDVFDCPKRSVWVGNYFNAGFFAQNADGSTIPVGNLADCGNIISQSKDNADWINVAKKKLTTIYTTNAGGCGMVQTDDLSAIPDLRAAVSGIPIARGGQQVSMDEIRAEGYDGSELYDTWHGFFGPARWHSGLRCGKVRVREHVLDSARVGDSGSNQAGRRRKLYPAQWIRACGNEREPARQQLRHVGGLIWMQRS